MLPTFDDEKTIWPLDLRRHLIRPVRAPGNPAAQNLRSS